ncbi:hypothetical protein RMAECT_0603 [Rickettsia rhipicephali str. Ect]|uniref:Uncharacterized protein n=1 Tax=Rickettsia rhipicephali str. Ect TaxID=1359199 RepID=A0A0F3PD46_RICRH|nr:hypothetical protein RMAECT_0603 [Rickettsia rhipicephali str. Ect]
MNYFVIVTPPLDQRYCVARLCHSCIVGTLLDGPVKSTVSPRGLTHGVHKKI